MNDIKIAYSTKLGVINSKENIWEQKQETTTTDE